MDVRDVRAAIVALALASAACAPPTERDTAGQSLSEENAITVELFAPGIVSSTFPEFASTFTPSGDTVFFNRTTPDRSRIDLLFSARADDGWSEPQPYPPLEGIEAIDPFVSPDGAYLYISADLGAQEDGPSSFDLWRIPRRGGDPTPERLPAPINSDSSDVFNAQARDGRMVFSSRRDGERLIYETRERSDSWDPPRRLTLGDGSSASNPAMSPDGTLLVFARSTSGGPIDLWLACRTDGDWGEPTRLPAPISSEFTDFAPGFFDGHLYFTSERPGVVEGSPEGVRPPGDIYRTPVAPLRGLC